LHPPEWRVACAGAARTGHRQRDPEPEACGGGDAGARAAAVSGRTGRAAAPL